MTKKTLNIKLDSTIYNQLDKEAKQRAQSKTHLVEAALKAYFATDIDTDSKDIDTDSKDIDTDSKIDEDSNVDTDSKDIDTDSNVDKDSKDIDTDSNVDVSTQNQLDPFTRSRIEEIERKLEILENSKINQQMLDERLAMATEPIWDCLSSSLDEKDSAAIAAPKNENLETLPENSPSEIALETTKPTSQDESLLTETETPQEAKTEETPQGEVKSKDFIKTGEEESAIAETKEVSRIRELINSDPYHWKTVASCKQDIQNREIISFLIEYGFKSEEFSFAKSSLSRWNNPQKRIKDQSADSYLACKTYEIAILPNLPKKE